jgi:hypothetical protein
MNRTHRLITASILSIATIAIVFVLCVAMPVLDTHAMSIESGSSNINLPGLTEDRYTGESKNFIELITDAIIPAMLPPTSGEGVCNIDITCDSEGNATN